MHEGSRLSRRSGRMSFKFPGGGEEEELELRGA